jgi:hypothetical protein
VLATLRVPPGEQLAPDAPWRIRLTDQVRALFIDDALRQHRPRQRSTACNADRCGRYP